jgi:hypothetical protein
MRKAFIETRGFTEWVKKLLSDEDYSALQQELLQHPDKGDVMPGCGGLRKLRIAHPNRRKGKRGGARVIYLHVPEANIIFMLDIYGKDEQDDLDTTQKKNLKELARQYKREAALQAGRKREDI